MLVSRNIFHVLSGLQSIVFHNIFLADQISFISYVNWQHFSYAGPCSFWFLTEGEGEGVTPLYRLLRYVRPQRVRFSAVLAINRVWFLHSILELRIFLEATLSFSGHKIG